MLHLEYVVDAFIVIAFIFFAAACAILYPYLRRERQADAAEIRELELKATPKHPSAS